MLSNKINHILRTHEATSNEEESVALEEIKKVVALEKGKGIGGSETLQQEEVDRFRGPEGLGFVNKKTEVQFKLERLI